jgi:peptidoglycan/LPS O-acetylase OafA/YrhL
MKYRPEIDGLRALAVLPVIFFHAGIKQFSGGYVGVDVFFVISGYLITTIIISDMAAGKFSLVNFYERRARRILPALFFVMVACLPFAWLWLSPSDLKDFGQSLVAVSTFSSNILFWVESGYFNTAAELKPLLHTWSLAVEEQYYILFPIFLMVTWSLGIKLVLILLSIVFLVSLSVAQWGAYNSPSASFYLLPTRGWELLIGVFVAFYLRYNNTSKSHHTNQVLSLLGFGMIFYSIVYFDENTPFPSLYGLIPTCGTGLLILSAVPNTFVHRLLSASSVVGLGLISYSAYLWHQPLLAFARHRLLGELSSFTLIIIILASLLMAYVSWKWVEKPFRNTNHIPRKTIFILSSISIISFIILGSFLSFKSYEVSKLNKSFNYQFYNELSDEKYLRKVLSKSGECWFNGKDGEVNIDDFIAKWNCLPKNIGESEIFVFGDSTAADISSGLRSQHKSIIQLGGAGCGLITNRDYGYPNYCIKIHELAKQTLSHGVKTVILSLRYDKNELNDEYITKILDEWSIPGVQVYLLPPPLIFDNFKAHFFDFHHRDRANQHSYADLIAFNAILKSVDCPANVKIIPMYDESRATYSGLLNGSFNIDMFYNHENEKYLRVDDIHLSNFGSIEFAKRLIRILELELMTPC